MVVNARYEDGILYLELKNGTEIPIDISDIVSGLVSDSTFNAHVNNADVHIQPGERNE